MLTSIVGHLVAVLLVVAASLRPVYHSEILAKASVSVADLLSGYYLR